MKNLFVILTLALVSGCGESQLGIAEPEAPLYFLQPTNSENFIYLHLETSRNYPEEGYSIPCRLRRNSKMILIDILEVKKPEETSTQTQQNVPARVRIELGQLMNGNYELIFNTKKGQTRGRLLVMGRVQVFLENSGPVTLKE